MSNVSDFWEKVDKVVAEHKPVLGTAPSTENVSDFLSDMDALASGWFNPSMGTDKKESGK